MTHSRPYRDADDLARLQQYNAAQIARDLRGWLFPGDIPHRLSTAGADISPLTCCTCGRMKRAKL